MPSWSDSKTVAANDATTRLSELLDQVEAGAEVTITRHGSPVAKLVPVARKAAGGDRAAAVERIRRLGAGLSLGGLKLKELIAEGRK